MAARAQGISGVSRSRIEKLLQEEDALAERELTQRPEVRILNRYAVVRANLLMAQKLAGSLALLWSTVVLLGGFVTALTRKDFWYLTFIGFMQAAGLLNAIGEYQFILFLRWFMSLNSKMASPSMLKALTYAIGVWVFCPVVILAYGPVVCFALSLDRLRGQDFGIDDRDETKANLKPALNIFYSLSMVQGALFISVLIFQKSFGAYISVFIRRHGFSGEVVTGYISETQIRCQNNQAPTKNWNLITYGAGLLDSRLPDDFMFGARVLNMLIEQKVPVKWVLIRSPRHRIQQLIGALAWRSPAGRVTRGLAARIVAHLASDLDLSQFPGAIECVSSLLDTYHHNRSEQEVLCCSSSGCRNDGNGTSTVSLSLAELIRKFKAVDNGTVLNTKGQKREGKPLSVKGTNEDLVLQGLRILENLAHNKHNCIVIYNTGLLSEITAPFNSDKLIEDIGMNVAWNKVVNASLRVLGCLMEDPGDVGKNVRRDIASSSKAIKNLVAVLDQKCHSNNLELQTHALDVLAKLFSDESPDVFRDTSIHLFIKKALDIFLDDKWMKDYFQDKRKKIDEESTNHLVEVDNGPSSFWEELRPSLLQKRNRKRVKALREKKVKEAQETASQHKEKAGEVVALLCLASPSNSEAIMNITEGRNVVPCLTNMLDRRIRTIECRISATETWRTEVNIGCRVSAAQILKQLCGHTTENDDSVKKTLLKKVLEELLNINRHTEAQAEGRRLRNNFTASRNDVENPPLQVRDHQERSTYRSMQQVEGRMLQAAQLSLYATIRHAAWANAGDFASVVVQLVVSNDFIGNLKVVIEENGHPTPACLAILKVTCEIIILQMQHDRHLPAIKNERIIDALSEASETMAGVESRLLLAGMDHDCYGVLVRPLYSVLVKQARDLLSAKEQVLANNNPPAGAP